MVTDVFSHFINSFQQSSAYLILSATMCSNKSEEDFIIDDGGALSEKELSNDGDFDFDEENLTPFLICFSETPKKQKSRKKN